MIRKTKVLYVKPKFEEFEYREGNLSLRWTYEYYEKEELDFRDELRLTESVKSFPIYKEVVNSIAKIYGISEGQAEDYLSRFSTTVIRYAFDEFTEDLFLDLIVRFISDLDGSPQEWNPVIWLDGIWMKDELVEINPDIKFRRPCPEDLAIEQRLDLHWLGAHEFPKLGEFPSAILEVKRRAKGQRELQEWLDKLLMTLRLFKIGSVENIKTKWSIAIQYKSA